MSKAAQILIITIITAVLIGSFGITAADANEEIKKLERKLEYLKKKSALAAKLEEIQLEIRLLNENYKDVVKPSVSKSSKAVSPPRKTSVPASASTTFKPGSMAPTVECTDCPKIIGFAAHKSAWLNLTTTPALQYEELTAETKNTKNTADDDTWTRKVVARNGRYSATHFKNKDGKRNGYISRIGMYQIHGLGQNRGGGEWDRETLGISDVKQNSSRYSKLIDGLSGQDLSREFRWSTKINGKDRLFAMKTMVEGTTEVAVKVNGGSFTLRGFTVSSKMLNQRNGWNRKETQIYVPVLGSIVSSKVIDSHDTGNERRWSVTSFKVSDEVLSRVKAAAIQ